MLLEVNSKREVKDAINLLHRKLNPTALARVGIWAEVHNGGAGFFGVRGTGRVAVEINLPPFKARPMGLIAKRGGKLFLCHNGRLNPRLHITQEEVFLESRCELTDVRFAKDITKRYAIVACISESQANVAKNLANFVHACQRLVDAQAQRLSDVDLERLARGTGKKRPGRRIAEAIQYERSPYVREWVLRRSAGKCDLCNNLAPFETRYGPFLEIHHVKPLAQEGSDTVENAVALCPNCHRKIHALSLKSDQRTLNLRVKSRS